MKPDKQKYIRIRTLMIGCVLGIFLIIIAARAAYIQVYCDSWLSQKAADEYTTSLVSHGKRGAIFDANNRELAVSLEVTSIAAYPARIEDRHLCAKALSEVLKLSRKSLIKTLDPKKKFVWIKRKVSPQEVLNVKALKLKGIGFIPEYNRFYPNKSLAAQVIGFSGTDGRGLEGIEFYYDNLLKGNSDSFTVLRDAFGNRFDRKSPSDKATHSTNFNGNNLILTIDSTIQYITEQALKEAVNTCSAKTGLAIVMSPKTGAILALAHFPFFNPNTFSKFDKETWRNRAITDSFEPGSTMKIFTAAGALASGTCTPDSIFYCENGAYSINHNIIRDTHKYGWLTLHHIIKYSSNIGMVKITEKMGSETLYNNLVNFSFGTKTGIDCPGETTGHLSHFKTWSKMDTGAISFGQGVSVSAIQLATAVSAIANKGIIMKPYIVQAMTDQNGSLIKNQQPERIRTIISENTAKIITEILQSVISSDGTGPKADLEGYNVCGKTGTAQKIDGNGKYSKDKYTSSFIGFVPSDQPEAVIFVVIDEPSKNYYGGIVAAPAFKKIAHKTLDYMNIAPTKKGSGNLVVYRQAGAKG
jgi:cell division protein FtsI (penicillin-binding protein 3)